PKKSATKAYRAWLLEKGTPPADADALAKDFARTPPEGWRPLTWHDLTPDLLGGPLPIDTVPEDWEARMLQTGLTVDEIEQRLDPPGTHQTLTGDAQKAFRDLFEQLNLRVSQTGMWRTLRKLVIPSMVYLRYWGANTSARSTFDPGPDNEFTGQFGELREK